MSRCCFFPEALRSADAERQRQLEQLSMACENLAEARQGGRRGTHWGNLEEMDGVYHHKLWFHHHTGDLTIKNSFFPAKMGDFTTAMWSNIMVLGASWIVWDPNFLSKVLIMFDKGKPMVKRSPPFKRSSRDLKVENWYTWIHQLE